MTRSQRPLGTLLSGAVVAGLLGCGQSSPPAVVATPVIAAGVPDGPARGKPADAEQVVKNDPAGPIPDGGSFPFPDDSGGKALAKTLTPPAPPPMPAAGRPPAPKERKLPYYLDVPAPPLPDAASSAPRLPMPDAKPARPVPLPDRFPQDLGGAIPPLPPRAELPTGPLTKAEGRDVSKPAELPILSARPVPDRAPLTDPTLEFTAKSVVSEGLPLRADQTGFQRINLPDPFENAEAAKPRTPVEENPNRSLVSPPPPRP